jgi:hypothetical protein
MKLCMAGVAYKPSLLRLFSPRRVQGFRRTLMESNALTIA